MMHRIPYPGAALLLLAALSAAPGCFELPVECEQSATCRAQYGPTSYCAQDGICDQYSAAEYTAAPCNFETVGPVFEKDTVNIGVILALDKGSEYSGLIEPIAKSIKLAQKDINNIGINGKKLGIVFCNTDGNNAKADAAAKHLASVGVQGVIGPDFSGYTVEVVSTVFSKQGILAISPSATSTSLSSLDDKDLFWRTVAPDRIQVDALVGLINHVVGDVITPAGGAIPKVAMLTREDDTYANGLNTGVIEQQPTSFTDSKTFLSLNYPNAGAGGGDDYSQVAISISEFNPDVVLIWGLTEVWDIAQQIDSLMESDNSRQDVIYIVADGGKDTVKAQEAGTKRPSLTGRIWGTSPRPLSADEHPPYKAFGVRWKAEYSTDADTHPFIANAYDATYLISLAAAGASEHTGTEMAKVMRRLTDPTGTDVVANQAGFAAGVKALNEGKKLDFSGASGDIEFDENGDPKSTNIALWCLEGRNIVEVGDLLTTAKPTFTPQSCNYNPQPQN